MSECQQMVNKLGSGPSFKCRVRANPHDGPCAAPEVPSSMAERRRWIEENLGVAVANEDAILDPIAATQMHQAGSLAAHVALDKKTPAPPGDDICQGCLGIASDMCSVCDGTGLAPGANHGPFFLVHQGAGVPLEAYDASRELVARLGWKIDAGRIVFTEFATKLSEAVGSEVGSMMKEFLEDRGAKALLGVPYDGREDTPDPVADEAPAEETMAAAMPPAEPEVPREGDQPLPVVNDRPAIQPLIIEDIHRRMEIGLSRYGTLLQPGNGRDMARDAYEEVLDLIVYFRGVLEERAIVRTLLGELTQMMEGVFPPEGSIPVQPEGGIERIFEVLAELQALHPDPSD